MSYKKDLKNIMIKFSDLNVSAEDDHKILVSIYNCIKAASKKEPDLALVRNIYNDRVLYKISNNNDFYHFMVKSSLKYLGFNKVAYPSGQPQEIQEEYDINKWADIVHKIYDLVGNNKMSMYQAIEHFSNTLDKERQEDVNFKRWLKYYQDGEHLKYKKAFQFPISGPGFYGEENAFVDREEVEKSVSKIKDTAKTDYTDWKSKLHSAIRRIDKLLRLSDEYVDPESQRELADLLHRFDQEVRGLRNTKTASDIAFKYAGKFNNLGYKKIGLELTKIAQQTDSPPEAEPTPEIEQPPAQEAPVENAAPSENAPENADTQPAPKSMVEEAFNKKDYDDEMKDDINPNRTYTLSDAAAKAQEIAGRLTNRREIRLMAELDIILDNIGIASMFPELLEAQSKMIEGHSYALTRITKILGMLSSGKNTDQISDSKKKELAEKINKEVNKTFEAESAPQNEIPGTEDIKPKAEEVAQPEAQPQPPPQQPGTPNQV